MATLKTLLEEFDINVDDIDNDDSKDDSKDDVKLDEINLEDIPEKQRPVFKKLLDVTENLKNEISTRDIMIKTLKSVKPVENESVSVDDNSSEGKKIFGVLDEDDAYAPVFSKIEEGINNIISMTNKKEEGSFKEKVISFAKENKDVVRYIDDMDKLLDQHPSMKNDIPKLYLLAKSISERRDGKINKAKDKINNKEVSENFRVEDSDGFPSQNTVPLNTEVKSISEAFDIAVKGAVK